MLFWQRDYWPVKKSMKMMSYKSYLLARKKIGFKWQPTLHHVVVLTSHDKSDVRKAGSFYYESHKLLSDSWAGLIEKKKF